VSPRAVAVAVLLIVGVGVELACCLGVLVMRDAYDKLHYTAPATTVGSLAIALAVVVEESLSQAGIKALLVFGALLVANPVLTHATARAARVRQYGRWQSDAGGADRTPAPDPPGTSAGPDR
jgi:monovalent cation/proton antiporter MnhG/PhaG subunit